MAAAHSVLPGLAEARIVHLETNLRPALPDHRPALHHLTVDGKSCERWVLADWYETGSYLYCDAAGCRSIALPAT